MAPMSASAIRSQRAAYDRALANELFDDAEHAARLRRMWLRITGRPDRLETLRQAQGSCVVLRMHFAGARMVPIGQILGSENRRADFDAAFRPTNRRVRERWLSVAGALVEGVTLPPVELIQLGDRYFVRDGHHRISVARAMRQEAIEATVTVLELGAAPPMLSASTACTLCPGSVVC